MALRRPASLVTILIFLTALALLAQVSFMMANYYANRLVDILTGSPFFNSLWQDPLILFPILEVVLIQFLFYVLFIATLWYITTAIGELFSLSVSTLRSLGLLLWVLVAVDILAANCYFFPYSLFSRLICQSLFNDQLTGLILKNIMVLCSFILLIAVLLALINLCVQLYRKQHYLRHGGFLFLIAVFIFLNWNKTAFQPLPQDSGTAEKPNIIFISFDALRPDFVEGSHLIHFIQSSLHFTHAYTPLARTSPSWTSILTAAYPLHNGIRENMVNPKQLLLSDTLPRHLKNLGYQTWYATDDRRYNNIGHYIGFDHVIGPSTGVDDFLIGNLNDFPLSNLFVNTPMGRWLFPYNYGNHSASATYDPDSFLHLIQAGLHHRNHQPLLLAIHLNVTGWPFYWLSDTPHEHMIDLYKKAVSDADGQFAKLLTMLQQNHLLNYSIVILLSDHGITLGQPHDRIISAANYRGTPEKINDVEIFKYYNAPAFTTDFKHDYGLDTSYGYGGDVLSLKQTHAVLAIKGYGISIGEPRQIDYFTSLMDIAPTLLALLKFPPLAYQDGVSLLTPSQRSFFIESGYTTEEMQKDKISEIDVLNMLINFYQVNPDGAIYIKPADEKKLISSKQYAVISGDWLLARYPAMMRYKMVREGNQFFLKPMLAPSYFVLVNLKTGEWTTELNSAFAAKAPASKLLKILKRFFNL